MVNSNIRIKFVSSNMENNIKCPCAQNIITQKMKLLCIGIRYAPCMHKGRALENIMENERIRTQGWPVSEYICVKLCAYL